MPTIKKLLPFFVFTLLFLSADQASANGYCEAQKKEHDCICDKSVPNQGTWDIVFIDNDHPLLDVGIPVFDAKIKVKDKGRDTVTMRITKCGHEIEGMLLLDGFQEGLKTKFKRIKDPSESPWGPTYVGMSPNKKVEIRFWGFQTLGKSGIDYDLTTKIRGFIRGPFSRSWVAQFNLGKSDTIVGTSPNECSCDVVGYNIEYWDAVRRFYGDKTLLDYAVRNRIPAKWYEHGWVHENDKWPGSENWYPPYKSKLDPLPQTGTPGQNTIGKAINKDTYEDMVLSRAEKYMKCGDEIEFKTLNPASDDHEHKVGGVTNYKGNCELDFVSGPLIAKGYPHVFITALEEHEKSHQKVCNDIKSSKKVSADGKTMDALTWENHPDNHAKDESDAYLKSIKTVCSWYTDNCSKFENYNQAAGQICGGM